MLEQWDCPGSHDIQEVVYRDYVLQEYGCATRGTVEIFRKVYVQAGCDRYQPADVSTAKQLYESLKRRVSGACFLFL